VWTLSRPLSRLVAILKTGLLLAMHPGWSRFCKAKSLLAHARGIAAEILFCGFAAKKIGAESPARGAKRRGRAQIPKSQIPNRPLKKSRKTEVFSTEEAIGINRPAAIPPGARPA
jgi:hypothetical protein